MAGFVILGAVGVVLLLVVLLVGDWFDALLPDVDLGDGLFSLPVLAGFTAAFGFAGAAVHAATDGALPAAVLAGAGAGAGVAWVTLRLTRGLLHMRTDEPLRMADLVGRPGQVVTDIRQGGLGEVVVPYAGQSLKVAARADHLLERGQQIVVVEALSPTSVMVASATDFWREEGNSAAPEPQ
jgi:membrane protein implicated in regulation of membrane protease activity